jgi:hypothetical protein
MPNETHLKRLISDAVFEAHHTHGEQAAGDRLHISREDSRIIASAVFGVLRRANVLLIDSLVSLTLKQLDACLTIPELILLRRRGDRVKRREFITVPRLSNRSTFSWSKNWIQHYYTV